MKKVAIFDVDGTIFRSSLLIELVNVLIDKKLFPADSYTEYNKEYLAWMDRKGTYEEYIMAVVRVFMKYIVGISYTDLQEVSRIVVAHHADRTYRYTRDLIKELKEKDYYILAISHSPKTVLDEFAKKMGFDKVYGMRYEVDADGKYTSTILDEEIIRNKNKVLERAVEKEGLTLEDSVGVGDTESDIKFLSMVAKPICFNPNSGLYKHAKEAGWKVVVERKDVVYEL